MELKSFVEPLFKEILDFVSPETVDDWAACVSNMSVSMFVRTYICYQTMYVLYMPKCLCVMR